MRELRNVDGTSRFEGNVRVNGQGYYCGVYATKLEARAAEGRKRREVAGKPRRINARPDKDFSAECQELLNRKWGVIC